MSLLSDDIKQFINFLKMDNNQIIDKYRDECELMNWDSNTDKVNIERIRTFLRSQYTTDNIFYIDMTNISNDNNSNLYRTILKAIDILNLNNSNLDNRLSKIFLGTPTFKDCSE